MVKIGNVEFTDKQIAEMKDSVREDKLRDILEKRNVAINAAMREADRQLRNL